MTKGDSVPVFVSVDSPMQNSDYVKTLVLLAESNPEPEVFKVNFSPANDRAAVLTRIRLDKSQKLIAVAKMNDGSLLTTSKSIKITTSDY